MRHELKFGTAKAHQGTSARGVFLMSIGASVTRPLCTLSNLLKKSAHPVLSTGS